MTQESGNYLAFPFGIASNGKTSQASSLEQHVKDELIQLILTNIGERLFLPEFGAGVRRLVFEGVDESTSGMTKAMISQAISRWLGNRVTLQDLIVNIQNETIQVTIQYRVAGTEDQRVLTFQRTEG
jgi:phage baseplate assembly protein W